jgi:hypothetical protein
VIEEGLQALALQYFAGVCSECLAGVNSVGAAAASQGCVSEVEFCDRTPALAVQQWPWPSGTSKSCVNPAYSNNLIMPCVMTHFDVLQADNHVFNEWILERQIDAIPSVPVALIGEYVQANKIADANVRK